MVRSPLDVHGILKTLTAAAAARRETPHFRRHLRPLLAAAVSGGRLRRDRFVAAALVSLLAPLDLRLALLAFSAHPSPSAFPFTSLFLASSGDRRLTAALHSVALRRGHVAAGDAHAATSLLSSYGAHGLLDDALKVFDEMPGPTTVTYNALLSDLAHHGRHYHGLAVFRDMLSLPCACPPNEDTAIALLACCAGEAELSMGRAVHAVAARRLGSSCAGAARIGTALIQMYAKCGGLEEAKKVFDAISAEKDVAVWTAMVAALAMHERGEAAVALFDEMRAAGEVAPDSTAFTCAIQACAHSGMAEKGLALFDEMTRAYAIVPRREHYGAVTDLLCRAGRLADAEAFLASMPMAPPRQAWGALLHSRVRAGPDTEQPKKLEMQVREALGSGDGGGGGGGGGGGDGGVGFLVGVSNAYARSGRWDDVCRVRERMVEKGVRKEKGLSSVDVDGEMVRFLAGDARHPLTWEVCEVLDWINVAIICES